MHDATSALWRKRRWRFTSPMIANIGIEESNFLVLSQSLFLMIVESCRSLNQ